MKRKMSAFLLCLVLFCGVLPAQEVMAVSPDGVFTIDTITAERGDNITVGIHVSENPGIAAMTISITYDSSVLEYTGYSRGILKDYVVVNHPDRNLLRFVNCEPRDVVANGLILSLKFTVKEDAADGFYPMDIVYNNGDFCSWQLKKLMPIIVPGGVQITSGSPPEPQKGDVNSDGSIDIKDLICLKSYFANQNADSISFSAADLNNDDGVDSVDVVILRKLLLGLPLPKATPIYCL